MTNKLRPCFCRRQSVQHACPKGVYVTASNASPDSWDGVIFMHTGDPIELLHIAIAYTVSGLYASGIFRFIVQFPDRYPACPPIITFVTEIYHPLVTPFNSHKHASQRSIQDANIAPSHLPRLSPGSFSLKHGFPAWYDADQTSVPSYHIVQILFYLRGVLSMADVLDSVPCELAAYENAWCAYTAFRSQNKSNITHNAETTTIPSSRKSSVSHATPSSSTDNQNAAALGHQRPGGARDPRDWNWRGVWSERVARCVQNSLTDKALFISQHQADMVSTFKWGASPLS